MTEHPCYGLSHLFDSIRLDDHERAAKLCAVCPVLDWCETQLEAARRGHTRHGTVYCGPQGTWAGQLIGGAERSRAQLATEERAFTDEQLKKAHRRYAAGDRDPRTVLGERVYQRKTSRRKRERRAA